MSRLDQERPRIGYELTTLLYELLEQVDQKHGTGPLEFMDPICDLLSVQKYSILDVTLLSFFFFFLQISYKIYVCG